MVVVTRIPEGHLTIVSDARQHDNKPHEKGEEENPPEEFLVSRAHFPRLFLHFPEIPDKGLGVHFIILSVTDTVRYNKMPPMKTTRERGVLLAILLTSTFLQSYGLNRPWSGKDVGYNGAVYSIMARNYVRYGFLQTKFDAVLNSGKAGAAEFAYHSFHHPLLLPILVALSFKVFGVNEWAARLVPLLFTLLSLWVFYLLSRELGGEKGALPATTVAAFIPMTLFYGSHVEVFGPLLLFFVLLTVTAYWRWFKTNKTRYLFLSALAFCLGAFVEWDIYLLSLLLPLHAALSKEKPFNRRILILPFLALCCFAAISFHAILVFGPVHFKEFGRALLYRQKFETVTTASAVMAPGQAFHFPGSLKPVGDYLNWVLFGYVSPGTVPGRPALSDYLLRNLLYLLIYFNPFVVFLACLGLYRMVTRFPDPEGRPARNLLFSILFLGLFRILFFYNETWEHRYIYHLLVPSLSYAAALGLKAVFPLRGPKRAIAAGGIVLFFLISLGTTWKLHQLNEDFSGKSLGELIRRVAAFEEKVMTSSSYSWQVRYYADRRIFFGVTTWERFASLREKAGDPACFLLSQGTSIEPGLLGYLEVHYTLRRLEGMAVFTQPSALGVSSQTK